MPLPSRRARPRILLGLGGLSALILGWGISRLARPPAALPPPHTSIAAPNSENPSLPPDETRAPTSSRAGSSLDSSGADSPFSALAATLAAILAESDDTLQETAWARLEKQLAAAVGLPSAVAHCTRPGASDAERELGRRLLRRWAADDAPAAARWAAGQPAGAVRQQAIDSVATLWADTDLPAAIDWAGRLPAGEERQGALLGIAYEAARTEPVSALALALELPENQLRDDLLAHAAAQCAALAPAAAIEVAREFPDALLRDRLLGVIATAWADTDPQAAAALALDSIGSSRLRDDAVIGIIQRWAQKDAPAAAAWVATFPEGPLHDTALDNLRRLRPPETAESGGPAR